MKFFNIPFAIGLCIDDIGWWHCANLKPAGGPPRTHGNEDPKPFFYRRLTEMGKNCGTRPMGCFVMSEFDRNNTCAKPCYNKPVAPINVTEHGTQWHNNPTEEECAVMDLVKEENAWLEFGLHGVRHGHFENNKWYSSEWARRPIRDKDDNFTEKDHKARLWDEENRTSETVADCYTELIRQYFTEEELSFPESFAPPNHAVYYDRNSRFTTGAVLGRRGVKYANAKISGTTCVETGYPRFGVVDHGMHILDRRTVRRTMHARAAENPLYFPRKVPWIETHFINFWYREKEWSQYLFNINSACHRMLARNTEQVHSQFFYNRYAKIINLPGKVIIDTTHIPQEAYDSNLLSSLVLKVRLGQADEIESWSCDGGINVAGYHKDIFGYGYLTVGTDEFMGRLPKGRFVIKYKTGKEKPECYADTSLVTYNLYNMKKTDRGYEIKAKIYGTQILRIKCGGKMAESRDLNILGTYSDEGFLYAEIKAKSMNGDTGLLEIIQ